MIPELGSARRPAPVFWRAHGHGSGLVLINGYSASAMAWPRTWLHGLERRFRVVTLDNRGSGWSRFADVPFSIADLADDVVHVLDEAEVERAIVVGFSMGGMVAQELALRAPARVSALALLGSRPPAPKFHRPPLDAAIRLVRPPAPGESLDRYFRALWTAAAAPGFADANPDLLDELTRQTVERPTPRGLLMHQLRAMSTWAHADLARIDAPTVVIHGAADRFSPPANGRALAELITGARLVMLDGVGHLIPLEAPDAVGDVLDQLADAILAS